MIRSLVTILAVLCLASSASAFEKKWTKVEISPNHPVDTVFGPFPSCANIDVRQDSLSTGVASVYSAGPTDNTAVLAEAGTLAKQFSSADGTTVTNIAPDEEGWVIVVDTVETVDGAGLEWSCSQYGNPVAVGGGATGAPAASGGGSKEHKWLANITTNALDLTIATTFNASGCMLLHHQQDDPISAISCSQQNGEQRLYFPVDTIVTGLYIVLNGNVAAASQCAFQLSDSSDTLFGTEIDIDGNVDVVTVGTVYAVAGLTQAVSAGDYISVQARESGGAGTCSAQSFGEHWMYITYEDA